MYTHPEKGKFRGEGGRGSQKPKFIKESMKLHLICKLEFPEGGGSLQTVVGVGGYFLQQH